MKSGSEPQRDAFNNYREIIDGIFGVRTFREPNGVESSNPIIGALANDGYATFRDNFISRLHRLHSIYNDGNCLPQLVNLLNGVADSKNWQGAFAELATIDYFNYPLTESSSFLLNPVAISVPPTDCTQLGASQGQNGLSVLDGIFPDFNVYFDTKVLQDTSKDILNGIYARIRAEFPSQRVFITSEFDPDSAPSIFSDHVSAIEKELGGAIRANPHVTGVQSKVVKGLAHRILWGNGTLVTGSGYSPYRHAQEFWPTVLKDAHQFVLNRPFLLVYVIFPWYNLTISSFGGRNRKFYRAVSRRVFCGHRDNCSPLASLFGAGKISKRLSTTTIMQASRSLAGLLFLEDKSISSACSTETNVHGYLYANPNATMLLTKTLFWDYVALDLHSFYDAFEYDNY